MNFLAHLFLSGESEPRMVGNFIADFIKGSSLDLLPEEMAGGVKLHRAIDTFTDNHPIVAQSKDKLRNRYRHYAGVIVDLYYDHFLAKLWDSYHSDPLSFYSHKAYASLRAHWQYLPSRAQYVLPYMERQNWLLHYALPEGIDRALKGMAHRTRFDSGMDEALKDLLYHYTDFEAEFREFFPDLMKFVYKEVPGIHLGGLNPQP
jgi:acyl carrier protein phosphodiesterase